MKPKLSTAVLEGREITTHSRGWSELLIRHGIPGGSWDRILKRYEGDIQKIINDYQPKDWKEKNLFLYGRKSLNVDRFRIKISESIIQVWIHESEI